MHFGNVNGLTGVRLEWQWRSSFLVIIGSIVSEETERTFVQIMLIGDMKIFRNNNTAMTHTLNRNVMINSIESHKKVK